MIQKYWSWQQWQIEFFLSLKTCTAPVGKNMCLSYRQAPWICNLCLELCTLLFHISIWITRLIHWNYNEPSTQLKDDIQKKNNLTNLTYIPSFLISGSKPDACFSTIFKYPSASWSETLKRTTEPYWKTTI